MQEVVRRVCSLLRHPPPETPPFCSLVPVVLQTVTYEQAALRAAVLFAAPLLHVIIAYSAHLASARAFDDRMVRDGTALHDNLLSHGVTAQQVEDLMAYHGHARANVSGYVGTSSTTVITSLMFLGITFAGLLAFKRDDRTGNLRGGLA